MGLTGVRPSLGESHGLSAPGFLHSVLQGGCGVRGVARTVPGAVSVQAVSASPVNTTPFLRHLLSVYAHGQGFQVLVLS